jgi:hypothetical protein
MFDAGSMEFSRRLQTKNLVFGVIAAMVAYVLWHNERFLIEPLSPIWKHYRDLGVFLLVHGVAGASALILAPMQFFELPEDALHQAAPGSRTHLRHRRAYPRSDGSIRPIS